MIDFEQGVGGDKLDIKTLLTGYTAANAANFIRFDASGADTLLMVDGDGASNGVNFQQVATLELVGISSLADMLANGNLVVS